MFFMHHEETPGLLCQLRGLLLLPMLRAHAWYRKSTAAQIHVGERVRRRHHRAAEAM